MSYNCELFSEIESIALDNYFLIDAITGYCENIDEYNVTILNILRIIREKQDKLLNVIDECNIKYYKECENK